MRAVSKEWKQGFEASVSKIRVGKYGVRLPGCESLEERFPGLTELDIGTSLLSVDGLSNLAGLKRLTAVTLGSGWRNHGRGELQHRVTGELFRCLRVVPIQKLVLYGCKKFCDADLALLRGLPLTSLDLEGSSVRSLDGLRGMALQCLDINGLDVRDGDLENLKGMPLVSLSMRYLGNVTDEGLQYLGGMPLADLNLQDCRMVTGAGFVNLRGSLLTDLNLCGCVLLEDESLRHLCEMPLSILELDNCYKLTYEGLRSLKCMPLTSLNLGDFRCERTDEGLAFLQGLPLTYIDLGACQFLTDMGLEYLRGMPLTSIDLAYTLGISDACVEILLELPLKRAYFLWADQLSCNALAKLCVKGVHIPDYDTDYTLPGGRRHFPPPPSSHDEGDD